MYVRHRHKASRLQLWCLVLFAFATAWLVPRAARAWIETSIRSDAVVLDIGPDGRTEVHHELVMRIKGGPLKGFELPGVDSDAQPLPNATVSPVNGASASDVDPLLLELRDDGTLRVDIDNPKGLRRGTYLFKFSYRTDLSQRGGLSPRGNGVAVRWVGPRFADGVDSVRVVFRVPAAPEAPQLTKQPAQDSTLADPAGVFLSTLRRASDKDELEVVRPHVAKGEPVVWEVTTARRAFPAFSTDEAVPAEPTKAPPVSPERRALFLGALLAVALVYALFVFFKGRALARSAKERQAEPRALVPMPLALRAVLAGVALAGAVSVALSTTHPTLAAALILVAMVLATQLAPSPIPVPRPPGKWLPLTEEEAFAAPASPLPGRLFDAGSMPGFVLFVLLLASFVAAALWLLPRSVYHALMLLLASACLLPIFLTGRASTLPADRARAPMRVLHWMSRRLRRLEGLKVVPWARIPDGDGQPDELRLLVVPRRAAAGLSAVEVGLEYDVSGAGTMALPWVIVRAREGSRAHGLLAAHVSWTRGRRSDERVAVLWPALPTRQSTLSLVQELVQLLADRDSGRQSSSKRSRSWGRSSNASKAGSVSSPAHAM